MPSLQRTIGLLLANEVAAACRPHVRRVLRTGRNIAAISRPIRRASAIHHQRHLAFDNDVRGFHRVRVVRITLVGPVLSDVGVTKPFAPQLFCEIGNIHRNNH